MRKHFELAMMCDRSTRTLTGAVGELEFLVEDEGFVQYVSIRPTESRGKDVPFFEYMSSGDIKDWVRNLKFYPQYSFKTGWCHRGYLSGARALADIIWMKLDFERPIVFCGWSLGGGIAQPLALIMSERGYEVNEVVTFGAPPAMVNAKSKFENEDIPVFNYRFRGDIVPTLMKWMPYQIANPIQIGGVPNKRNKADHGIEFYIEWLKVGVL